MLSDIKEKIVKLKGKKIKVFVDIGRNKCENYEGEILETYQNIWTLRTSTDIKSFGYNDILTKNVIIKF